MGTGDILLGDNPTMDSSFRQERGGGGGGEGKGESQYSFFTTSRSLTLFNPGRDEY